MIYMDQMLSQKLVRNDRFFSAGMELPIGSGVATGSCFPIGPRGPTGSR